jgi:hypothetical protein
MASMREVAGVPCVSLDADGVGGGVSEDFVDRPLVVGMGSVLLDGDPAIRSDQEVGGQAEAATRLG